MLITMVKIREKSQTEEKPYSIFSDLGKSPTPVFRLWNQTLHYVRDKGCLKFCLKIMYFTSVVLYVYKDGLCIAKHDKLIKHCTAFL